MSDFFINTGLQAGGFNGIACERFQPLTRFGSVDKAVETAPRRVLRIGTGLKAGVNDIRAGLVNCSLAPITIT